MAATAVANIVNRNTAASAASAAQRQQQGALQTEANAQLEQVPTAEQVQGAELQSYADRGLNLGDQGPISATSGRSPAVQEALNRRARVITGIRAGSTAQQAGINEGLANQRYGAAAAGGDPFSILFNLFAPSSANPTGPAGTGIPPVVPGAAVTAFDPNNPYAYTG